LLRPRRLHAMRCQLFLLVCLLSLLSGAPYTQVRAQNSSRNHREGTGNNQSGTKSDTDTSHSTASSSREKISTSSTGSSSSSNGADGFDVYQSKIEFAKKQKEGRKAIEQTLRSSSTEHCDWRVTPLQFLKGQYCGKHYKIFGLNRHMNESSKEIKKRYRKLSLLLHPDKNPGREAPRAFSILTDGYNCLMNKECKDSYDKQLHSLESDEAIRREALLNRAKELSKQILERLHFHISRIAASIEQSKNVAV
jgi:hypothetical protein